MCPARRTTCHASLSLISDRILSARRFAMNASEKLSARETASRSPRSRVGRVTSPHFALRAAVVLNAPRGRSDRARGVNQVYTPGFTTRPFTGPVSADSLSAVDRLRDDPRQLVVQPLLNAMWILMTEDERWLPICLRRAPPLLHRARAAWSLPQRRAAPGQTNEIEIVSRAEL